MPASARALAKAVLITRNEHDLIDDFLRYWSFLLGGAQHVHVVDNGSSDARVEAAYARHAAAGGRVVRDGRPFSDAVHFMSEHMAQVARGCEGEGECEFIIPIETDEFLVHLPSVEAWERRGGGGGDAAAALLGMRAALHDALRAVPRDVSMLRYGAVLGSLPGGPGIRPAVELVDFAPQDVCKVIVRAEAFERMVVWSHVAAVRPGGAVAQHPELGLLHYSDTSFRRTVERAAAVLAAYPYFDAGAPLGQQFAQARALADAPIQQGHKLKQYLEFLRRAVVIEEFARSVGRAPTREELGAYAGPEAVRAAAAAGRLRVDQRRGQDLGEVQALLWHEPSRLPEWVTSEQRQRVTLVRDWCVGRT